MWKGGGRREYAARRRRRTQEDVQSQKQKGNNDDARGCRRERAKFFILCGKINKPATEKRLERGAPLANRERGGVQLLPSVCRRGNNQLYLADNEEKKNARRAICDGRKDVRKPFRGERREKGS